MIDAIIIILCILAAIGIGSDSLQLLPSSVLEQVSSIEGLRLVTAAFSAIIGLAIGLVVQTSYRRLVARIRSTSIETIITRAIGLVVGLLLANL
ncbi:MAG: PIN/TRAM domain-containing protein, partial [Xenococcaceae cyanobacterium]